MSNQPGQPSNPWNQPSQSWGEGGQGSPGGQGAPWPGSQPSYDQQEGTQLRPPTGQPGGQPSASPYPQQPQHQPSAPQQGYGQQAPQQQAPQHQQSAYPPPAADAMPSQPQLLVVTTDSVAGHAVERSLGPVLGVSARTREIGRKEDPAVAYPALLQRTRHEAITAMAEQAGRLGADAVIGLRFDSSEITQTLSEVVAYGTAVTLRRS